MTTPVPPHTSEDELEEALDAGADRRHGSAQLFAGAVRMPVTSSP